MEAVKAFNQELSTLYECKPPISRAKMTQLTKSAIKAIKLYKHVVQSVEKFIQKCRPEYKVPGLYVIDSIVRQSRHQFSQEKDVFAPRFAKNIHTTFTHLFKCPPDEKAKIVRVLNLWQKNSVFSAEIIQPLLDLANPEKADSLPAVPEKIEKKRVEPEWLKEQAAQAGTEHTKKGAPTPQKKSRAHKHSSPEDKTLALVSNLLQQAQEGSSEHQQLQQLQLIQETIQKQTKSQQTRASNKETLKLDEAVLQKIQNLTKQLTSLANQGSTSAPEDKESSTPPAPEETPPLPEEKTETSFNSALLEFDYGDEEEETETKKPSPRKATPPPEMPPLPPQMPPPQQTPPQMPPQVVSHVPPNIPPPVSLPAEKLPGPPPAAPMVSNLQASLEAVQKLTDELNHAQSQQEQMQKYMQHTDQQIRQQIPPPGHPPPGHPPPVHPPPVHPPPGHPPGHPPPLPEFFHQRPPFPMPPPFQPQLPPAPQQAAEQYQPEFPSDDIMPHAVTSPRAMVSDDAPVVVIEESPPKDDGRGRSKSPRKKRSRSRSNSRSKSPHSKSRHRSKRRHRSRSRDRDRSRGRRSRSRSRERDRSRRRDREGDHRSRKDDDRERKKGFPSIKDRKASVCSLTIWLGRLPKSVTENEIRRLVEEHGGGEVKSVQIVSARGCAYVLMADRLEAAKILDNLKYAKLHGSNLKIDWAPGVGVKDKKYKDYWDVDRGVSYIPWDSFPKDPEKVDQLEEGSVFDIDSLPEEVKKLRQVQPVKEATSEAVSESQANAIPVLPVMGTSLPLPPHPTLPSQPGVPIPPPIVSATSEAGPDVPPQPQLLHAGLPPPRIPTAPVMRMPIMPSGVLSPFMSIPPVGVRLPAGFVPGQPMGGGIPQPGGVIAAPGGLPSIPQTTPSPQSSGDTQLVTNTTTAISSPSPFSALMRPGVPLPTGPRGVDGLPTPSSLAVTQATQLLGQMPNRLMGLLPPRITGLSLPQPIRPATDNKRLTESSSEPKGLLGNPPGLPGPLVAGMLNLAPDHMLENQLNKEEMDILAEKKADKTDDINPHLEAEKVDLGGPPLGPPPVSLMGDISQFAGPALRMVRPANLGQAVLPQGMVPGLMQIPRMMVPGGMVRLPGQGIPVSLGGLRLATPGMLPPTSGLPRGLQQGMLPTVPPDIMNIIRPNPPVPTIETPEEEKADNPKDVDERVIPDYNASSPFQGEDTAEGMFGNGPAPEKTKEDEDFRKDRDLREPWPRLRGAPDFGPRGPPPLMADFQRGPRPWGPPFRGPPPRGMPPRGLPPGGPPLRGPPPPREGFGPDGWGRDQDWRRGPPPPLDPDFPGPREDKDWRSSGPQHWERGRGFFPDGQDREERGFGREPRRDFDHRRDRDRERDFDRDRDRSFDRDRDRDHRRERDHDYRVRDRDSERGRDRKEDGSKSFSKEKPTSEQSNDSSDKSRRKSRWAPVANEEPKPLLDIVIPPLMPKTRQLSAPSPLMEEKPKIVSVTPTPLVKSAPSEAAEAPKEVKSTETPDSPAKAEKDETTTPHPEKQVPEPTTAAAENETKAENEKDPAKDTTSEAGQNSIKKVEKDASEKA